MGLGKLMHIKHDTVNSDCWSPFFFDSDINKSRVFVGLIKIVGATTFCEMVVIGEAVVAVFRNS